MVAVRHLGTCPHTLCSEYLPFNADCCVKARTSKFEFHYLFFPHPFPEQVGLVVQTSGMFILMRMSFTHQEATYVSTVAVVMNELSKVMRLPSPPPFPPSPLFLPLPLPSLLLLLGIEASTLHHRTEGAMYPVVGLCVILT